MTLEETQIQILVDVVISSLNRVYQDDLALVRRPGLERAIAFRFGLYFYEMTKNIEFLTDLDIDLEYNKNGNQPKRTPRRPNGTAPDFILHNRGDNYCNVLVIEFKGWWNNQSREDDLIKLEDFTHPEGEYAYGLGMLIEIGEEVFDILRVHG